MKKITSHFILFLLIGAIYSCDTRDKNVVLVQEEFNRYVQNTFDNPQSLKEIVEITPSDTISIDGLKSMIQMELDECEKVEKAYLSVRSKENKNIDDLTALLNKYTSHNILNNIEERIDLLERMISMTNKSYNDFLIKQSELRRCFSGLRYEAPLYEYKISYSISQGVDLKLETLYAYVDSLDGFKMILPENITMKDYSKQQSRAYFLILESAVNRDTLIKITELLQESDKETKSFLLVYSK